VRVIGFVSQNRISDLDIEHGWRGHELAGAGGLETLQLVQGAVEAALKAGFIADEGGNLGGASDEGAGEGDDVRPELFAGIERGFFQPVVGPVLEMAALVRPRGAGIGHVAQILGGFVGLACDEVAGAPVEQASFDAGNSPEAPGCADDALDQDLFQGAKRLELGVHGLPESLKLGGVFVADQRALGEQAVTESIA